MKTYLIYILLFAALSIHTKAQQKDPYAILEDVKSKFGLIEDYTVDALIKVDVNFLRVPETQATIYFKQPDKVRMMSDGFALLPKEGINFSPLRLLKNDFSAIFVKSDSGCARIRHHIIRIIKLQMIFKGEHLFRSCFN